MLSPFLHPTQTLIYTYEQKCSTCSGTGFSRGHAGGRRGGRGHGSGRASLCTCLMCHGIGGWLVWGGSMSYMSGP